MGVLLQPVGTFLISPLVLRSRSGSSKLETSNLQTGLLALSTHLRLIHGLRLLCGHAGPGTTLEPQQWSLRGRRRQDSQLCRLILERGIHSSHLVQDPQSPTKGGPDEESRRLKMPFCGNEQDRAQQHRVVLAGGHHEK